MKVNTSPDPRFYQELARQDLSFDQAVAELVDNSISADAHNIEIHLEVSGDVLTLLVADDGHGMALADITDKILRMGGTGQNPGPMNEHGFGLKNSLSRLTEGTRSFLMLTRDDEAQKLGRTYLIKGPLSPDMFVELVGPAETIFWQKNISHLKLDTGTRVSAETSLTFLNTALQRRGRPFQRLDYAHVEALTEHLGVFYRPFLDNQHKLFLKWKNPESSRWMENEIKGLPVPYQGSPHNERIQIEYEGATHDAYYKWGKLNEEDSRTRGHKIYYQGNALTQGIDVKVRKRVILVHQLTELFGLQRHSDMNDLVGELELDDPIFSTVNNKTGLDRNNPVIERLVDLMSSQHLPPHDVRALVFGEAGLRRRIATTLKSATPDGSVQELAPVWTRVGVEVDIVQTVGSKTVIYEIKNRELDPVDVYQLVMYWDAMTVDHTRPFLAKLVSMDDVTPKVRNLITYWNRREDATGKKYNLAFVRGDELIAGGPSTRRRSQ